VGATRVCAITQATHLAHALLQAAQAAHKLPGLGALNHWRKGVGVGGGAVEGVACKDHRFQKHTWVPSVPYLEMRGTSDQRSPLR
jgi:hypothetical protein